MALTFYAWTMVSGEKKLIGKAEKYNDAKREIQSYLGGKISSAKRVIASDYFDKYIINGKEFWIDWE